jgi:hypothetical protein
MAPEATVEQSYFSIYVFIAFVIIFIIIGGIVYYTPELINIKKEWLSNNVIDPLTNLFYTTKDLLTGKNNVQPNEDTTSYGPASVTNDSVVPADTTNMFKQTWCLVGEDMAGRWCVQVPGESACDKDRSFPNKNDCENSNDTK